MRVFLASCLLFSSTPAAAPARAEIFRGENCSACHARIRDRQAPPWPEAPEAPKIDYDVIVVGGGFAGLSAAYFLRDLNVLVLEKEDKIGGHGRAESWRGIEYPTATVYFNEKPYGAWGQLFQELGLNPIPVPAPQDTLVVTAKGRRIVDNFWDEGIRELPYDEKTKDSFLRFRKDIKEFIARGVFKLPLDDSKPEAWGYDRMSFWDYLTQRYTETLAAYAGRYVQDMLGAGPKEISALAALVLLCTGDEGYYTWESGLSPVAQALEKRLEGRIRTGALVVKVEPHSDGVLVTYESQKQTHRVRAKAAVLALSAHVIRKILSGASPQKAEALSRVRYSAYAVTMVGFKEPVWSKSYMLWSDNTTLFTSLLFTDWPKKEKNPGPQVALAYTPLGSEDGRRRLLHTSDAAIKKRALKDIEKILPGSSEKAEELRVIRWGHAEPIPYPGYLSQIRPAVARPMGRVFFAGEATEIPAMEGAIFSAHRAAAEVRSFLKSPQAQGL